jgi:hypothetical protein
VSGIKLKLSASPSTRVQSYPQLTPTRMLPTTRGPRGANAPSFMECQEAYRCSSEGLTQWWWSIVEWREPCVPVWFLSENKRTSPYAIRCPQLSPSGASSNAWESIMSAFAVRSLFRPISTTQSIWSNGPGHGNRCHPSEYNCSQIKTHQAV